MSAIMLTDTDIIKCFEFAKELTLEIGKMLKCSFEDHVFVEEKCHEVSDFVTNYDYKIEKLFIDALSKKFPDHKIITEETENKKEKESELTDAPTWFLDPIDGTTNFIHGFPHFCTSIGLTVYKEPVLGIIYNPLYSELYTAIKGKGAFLNGKPICTSKVTELTKAMAFINPQEIKLPKDRDIYVNRIETLAKTMQGIRSIGSAALCMAYIARGMADCLCVENLKPWNIAAGTVIIREAGGTVLDIKGGTYNIMMPRTVAASCEILAKEMCKLIVDTDLKTQRKRLKRN